MEIKNEERDKIENTSGKDEDAISQDVEFELLLHRKTCGKTVSQRTSMKKYYRDIYKKTGVFPGGLLIREGRKASGRKSTLSKEVEKRFIEMVKEAADDDVNACGFITKNLRTIVNFHRRLEEEFGKIPVDALYPLAVKHNLKKYLEKPDYNNNEQNKILSAFLSMSAFDMIQIDGCEFKYIEIKDESGFFKRPCNIEFMDLGSRYMLAMDIYFSESNENCVDAFSKFLRSTPFPEKTINIRPDRSKGFLNLKRVLHELNLKYSFPKKFYFSEDFARARKPKDKAHLESSHRRLHGFEDFIINKLPPERLSERVSGVKIKTKSGRIEIVTISRFDITLEQLRDTGLCQRYVCEHNERLHTFSESGRQQKWKPKDKMEIFLKGAQTFRFKEADIEDCLKYGFRKEKASVSHTGQIRFKNRDYQVVSGDFYGGRNRVNVKVSEYKNKLYVFEPVENGVGIGEAILIDEYKPSEQVKKTIEKKLKQNEFETLAQYLEKQGMTIKKTQLERLMELYKQGLNYEIAAEIIQKHKNIYDCYLNNPRFDPSQVGIILCNLFFTHFIEHKKNW